MSQNAAVIICAAGSSSRFGGKRKKPFVDVAGRAAFMRSVEIFSGRDDVKQILLAIPEQDQELVNIKWGPNLKFFNTKIYIGGEERFDTVAKGLELVKDDIDREKFLPFAAAIEMIHTYSLIHDDLPAMDDDDLRRGKPSCHKQFGEGYAILAGDALLTLAFEICAKYSEIPSEAKIKIILEYASASGFAGMVGGQVLDLESSGKDLTIHELSGIHVRKTARLIAAPLVAGSIVADASEDELENIRDFGINLGLAFQIVDDILDVTGEEEDLGKKVGSDESNDKATYPSLCGIEESKMWANSFIDNAKKALEPFGERSNLLYELADFVLQRSN